MRNVFGCLTLVYGCVFFSPVFAAEVSCECPTLGCDPCSVNKGVTFYTEKCGPRASKIKSCARPTCIPIDTATKECPNPPKADSGPREPVVIAEVPKVNAAEEKSMAKVGRIKVIKGSVKIVNAEGKATELKKDGEIRETDTVVAAADGAAVVEFDGGNKLHVHPETEVEVKEYKDQKDVKARKALLNLIKGKIRSQVEQKYNGKTSYFKIETKSAVAGVRGTDFVIEHTLGQKIETRVETIEGRVQLGGREGKEVREINRGEGATFTVAVPSGQDKDLGEFIEKGTLSPIYKIPPEKLRALEFDSRVDIARAKKTAKGEPDICSAPRAKFNECSWEKSGSSCIRRRCNANGDWAEAYKLPGAAAANCPASSGFVVQDCDY